jgi:hypothetical protein
VRGATMTTIRTKDIPRTLRKMSTEDVAAWNASFREGTPSRALGELELQRRRDVGNRIRGWIAIGISAVALIVSMVSLYVAAR